MDTRILRRNIAAAVIAAGMFVPVFAQSAEDRLFSNGGFEQDLTGWRTATFGTYTVPSITIEQKTVPEGLKALKLSASDDNTRGWAEQRFTVQPDTVYIIEATVKAASVTHNRMGIQIIEYPAGSDTALSLDIKKTLPIQISKNTQDWTPYQATVKTSPETRTLTVRAYLGTHGAVKKGATAWVDGIRITALEMGSAVNLLPNADFEQKTVSNNPLWQGGFEPVQWTLWTAKDSKNIKAAIDTAEKRSGNQSVRFELNTDSRLALHTTVPVDGSKRYTFSASLKTEGIEGGVYARIMYLDEKNKQITGKLPTTHIVRETTAWTDYSVQLTPPPETAKIKIECFTDNARGTVWFDSCSLIEAVE